RKSIATVAGDLRELSHRLHPATLEILGFLRALRAQCDDLQRLRGITSSFETNAIDEDASPPTAMCLFRVLQEGLMNLAKHSGSDRAWVSLMRRGDQLELRIRD